MALTAPASTRSGVGVAGYWIASADGGVHAFGEAVAAGVSVPLGPQVVSITSMGHGWQGYWLAGSDGGVFASGDAPFHGSLPALGIHADVVDMAAIPDGSGYWLAGSDGGVFTFGDSDFHGSLPDQGVSTDIVAMEALPDGSGYWLLGADGAVFSFGSAVFHGSLVDLGISARTVGMAALADGSGYWLLGADGGLFAFGEAVFQGSLPGLGLSIGAVGLAAPSDGSGYLIVARDGSVHPFGAVAFHGSCFLSGLQEQVVGLAVLAGEGVLGAKAAGLLRSLQVRLSTETAVRPNLADVAFPVGGIAFPAVHQPRVSIVIPVHGKSHLTVMCLSSIAAAGSAVPYEVIVVDDNSPDDTTAMLRRVKNVKVVHNRDNLGFTRACNAGIAEARGEYTLLLNNDTEVTAGWLEALVRTADDDPTVGVVGAKLVYPDGILQEAGGIIWNDGSGMNFGRGEDPDKPEYNYAREVDYCSGAAILVRSDLLDGLGGLDERFAPAYYEDTDLAFAARSLGYKVIYQPKACVVHHEGGSHGTDLNAGIKRYQNRNRLIFLQKWEKELSAQYPPVGTDPLLARDRRRGPRAVIIDHMVPLYDQDSGSVRMLALVSILIELGFVVSFVPGNKAEMQPYTDHLQQMGVEVLYGDIELGPHLRGIGRDLTLCILSRPNIACEFIGTVRAHVPWATIVYDTVDLHYVRERRYGEILGDLGACRASDATREIELAMVRAADLTLTVSPEERQTLLGEVPDATIFVVPNIHADRPVSLERDQRHGLLFVGSFLHDPNRDAAHHLVRDVMPLLRRALPEVRLTIAGSNPTPDIEALATHDVEVLGWVPELEPLYEQSRIFVAPLRYGAGMKGKIGESLSNGVPTVTSTIGAEGMGLVHGEHVLVADDPASFADEVVRLYSDKELWSRLAEQGRSHIVGRYSPATVREHVREILAGIGALPGLPKT